MEQVVGGEEGSEVRGRRLRFAGWREGGRMQGVRRKEWERPIGGRRLLLQHVMCRGRGPRTEGKEREVDSFVAESRI